MNKVRIPTHVQDDIDYDFAQSEKNLLEWKRHLLRPVHQDGARNEILNNLNSSQCMIIMDWAMKFLPFQFRENQSDFFGKKA